MKVIDILDSKVIVPVAMKYLILFLLSMAINSPAFAAPRSEASPVKITYTKEIFQNSALLFEVHHGAGSFGKAMAMNVSYEPVKRIREQVEQNIGYKLKIFTGWNATGEAHITTITPPEFTNIFSTYVTIQEIDNIARANNIQDADLRVDGLGRGVVVINNRQEETYFILVHSEKLLKIRREIWKLLVSRGGDPKSFDADHFYPHITLGFTLRDLHESDGVLKDRQHSLDQRFNLELE